MMKSLQFILIFLLTSFYSFGQSNRGILVPAFKDKYSAYVKKLESGQTSISYKDFRESFIVSEQFKIASRKIIVLGSLKKEMYALMSLEKYQEIIEVTKAILSIDYTSMTAHKILRQTYKIVGDTANVSKYKSIQFGLLNSIVKNGDGKTCATAWPVIQLDEEYFILQMLGASLLKQSTDNEAGLCDKMQVKTEEGDKKV